RAHTSRRRSNDSAFLLHRRPLKGTAACRFRNRGGCMNRVIRLAAAFVVVLPLAAQTNLPDLVQAQQVLVLADSAGAQVYAKSLYDDAAYRIRFAQENINSPKPTVQEQARM